MSALETPSGGSAVDLDTYLATLDGIVKDLFSVGLSLSRALKAETGVVRHDVTESLEHLDAVIRNIRSSAMAIRPQSALDDALANLRRAQASIDLLSANPWGPAATEASHAVNRAILALSEAVGNE